MHTLVCLLTFTIINKTCQKQQLVSILAEHELKHLALDAEGNILHQLYKLTNDGDDAAWKNAVAAAVYEQVQAANENIVVGISAPGLPNNSILLLLLCPAVCRDENFAWKDFYKHLHTC